MKVYTNIVVFKLINSGIVQKMISGLDLFWTFFKIGLFTFGGGAAMLPLLRAEVVEKRQWASDEELLDYYSIGQCTPGIIAINTATFIGYKMRGYWGAVLTTFGVVMPSVIVITLIAALLQNYMQHPAVAAAFAGIRIVVVALILEAVVELWKKGIRNRFGAAVFVVSLVLLAGFGLGPVWVVLLAAVGGVIYLRSLRK